MYRHHRNLSSRSTAIRRLAHLRVAIVAAASLVATAQAGAGESPWSLDSGLDASGQFEYRANDETRAVQKFVMAQSWLEMKSHYTRWSTGLFANYAYGLDVAGANSYATGAFLKFRFARWSTTIIGGQSGDAVGEGIGVYGSVTRLDIDDRQYVGIDAFGALHAPMSPSIMLVYGRDITRSLSVSAAAGASTADGSSRTARLEIGWNVW